MTTLNNKTPKEVERKLNTLFKKYGVHAKPNLIKQWVWAAKGKTTRDAFRWYQRKIVGLFPPPKNINEENAMLQICTDAWNAFPHKTLGGKSPYEVYSELTSVPDNNAKNDHMPTVIVGGQEMSWEDYEYMINEMEKMQQPFAVWIKTTALPAYKKYLGQCLKNTPTREQHFNVADIFFQRALHVGFINLVEVHPHFVQNDFPHWWTSHVLYSHLKPAQVRKSLLRLFQFLELVYGIDRALFGFKN